MELLYDGRPRHLFGGEENPLRKNPDTPASRNFENVQFPTRPNFVIDSSGIASLDANSPYLYDFENSLSTSEENRHCGAGLGPPTVLAQACDASMDFLLGPSVSIGKLTSTAKAVRGEPLDFDFVRAFTGDLSTMLLNIFCVDFFPEEPVRCLEIRLSMDNLKPDYFSTLFQETSRLPRWQEWYTQQHSPVVDFVDEWQGFYKNITDSREMPVWFDNYLNIEDKSIRRLEPRREGRIFCRDDAIRSRDRKDSIVKCHRAWLGEVSNPYRDYIGIYQSTLPPLPSE